MDVEINVSQKFKEWWRKYDDVERIRLIKKKMTELSQHKRRMDKANDTYLFSMSQRTGIRGGRNTTLDAASYRASKAYLDSLEELKWMVVTM